MKSSIDVLLSRTYSSAAGGGRENSDAPLSSGVL